jgi:Protein of unknown function (DUF3485)
MTRVLTQLAALTIVIASGAVHGVWTGRWSSSREFQARVEALARVPISFGDWKGKDEPLDDRTIERAGISGHVSRRYQNSRGEFVSILLICGRPGPISVHTPEICYAGAGYEPMMERRPVSIDAEPGGQPGELWVSDFSRPGRVAQEFLRIFYGWNSGQSWKASNSPRVEFGGAPALYKVYIVRPMTRADEPLANDLGVRFAKAFLPELKKSLASPH